MTGARSQAEALLLSALSLKAEWLGSDVHASLLGELCDLHAVMEDAEAATAVAGAPHAPGVCPRHLCALHWGLPRVAQHASSTSAKRSRTQRRRRAGRRRLLAS
jgi:hypothetical protein